EGARLLHKCIVRGRHRRDCPDWNLQHRLARRTAQPLARAIIGDLQRSAAPGASDADGHGMLSRALGVGLEHRTESGWGFANSFPVTAWRISPAQLRGLDAGTAKGKGGSQDTRPSRLEIKVALGHVRLATTIDSEAATAADGEQDQRSGSGNTQRNSGL